MLTNARTPIPRKLRKLFLYPDRLQAVFDAAAPIKSFGVLRTLRDRIEHLRDIAVHHALDRQNDLPPQQEAALYRDIASAIEALGITGDPRRVREQMHEHLVAAIQETEGADINLEWLTPLVTGPDVAVKKKWLAPVVAAIDKAGGLDADLRLRELLEHLLRAPAVFRAAASQIERDQAHGDLQWLPGPAPVYPPLLLKNIEDIWESVLNRAPTMTVNPKTGRAGGSFIGFAVACLELLALRANPTAIRAAILRDRERRAERSG